MLYVFVAVALAALAAGAYFGFGINPDSRKKMHGKVNGFFTEMVRHKFIYLSLVIPFILLIVFYYIPIVLGLGLSFFEYIRQCEGRRSCDRGPDFYLWYLLSVHPWTQERM